MMMVGSKRKLTKNHTLDIYLFLHLSIHQSNLPSVSSEASFVLSRLKHVEVQDVPIRATRPLRPYGRGRSRPSRPTRPVRAT